MTPLRIIVAVMVVLSVGVAVSAVTTRDRMWWAEAFSNLGVFDDFSSLMFNGALILAGIGACVFAHRLAFDLRRLRRRSVPGAAAVVVPALVATAGVAISMVGVFTESAHRQLHDFAAMSLASSFAGLLFAAALMLRGCGTPTRIVTACCSVLLVLGAGLLTGGGMTLAAFELLMFALFFLWLCTASREIHVLLNGKEPRR